MDRAEYHKPLGKATAVAKVNADGVYTREFASGTRVMHQPGMPGKNRTEAKCCIWWADGTTTGNTCGQ
jgi:hypothetical protein